MASIKNKDQNSYSFYFTIESRIKGFDVKQEFYERDQRIEYLFDDRREEFYSMRRAKFL